MQLLINLNGSLAEIRLDGIQLAYPQAAESEVAFNVQHSNLPTSALSPITFFLSWRKVVVWEKFSA